MTVFRRSGADTLSSSCAEVRSSAIGLVDVRGGERSLRRPSDLGRGISERSVAIVGGGPMCTYAMERLAALVTRAGLPVPLRISVFERCGRFGAGAAHSDLQPPTSYMNRIAGQIALGADETNRGASQLLPKEGRPTFLEWCRRKHAETGKAEFYLEPAEVPRRYLHGMALCDMFKRYVALLSSIEDVRVDLYDCEVVDVRRDGTGSYFVFAEDSRSIRADYILFVTGHPRSRPAPQSQAALLSQGGTRARYIDYAYPLERQLGDDRVPPGSAIGVLGLGLTAIDIFLYLTEGRGGRFLRDPSPDQAIGLTYVPSGREPAVIVAVGPSGLPIHCRPFNAKQGDVRLEHRGVFFTCDAVRALRLAFGKAAVMPDGTLQRQLDFERHAFPLVVLEMAFVYYKTLFGEAFGEYLRLQVDTAYRQFLREGAADRDAGIACLMAPVDACFDQIAYYVSHACRDEAERPLPEPFTSMQVLSSFRATLELTNDTEGSAPRAPVSRWGHPIDVRSHRFDWRSIHDGLSGDVGLDWRTKVIAKIERDNLDAAQGNLSNPVKAACDGVWRDLRRVFCDLVDRGGLTAQSHRRFVSVYMRYYNRLSNGAGLEAMSKVLALIKHGILDVSIGPCPTVLPAVGERSFRIYGPHTKLTRDVDIVVDGKLHAFDPELDAAPLYPNMLRRGLVRKWRNPGPSPADDFVPGGIDLSDRFHPLQCDGAEDARLTFLGVPAEGVASFQASAARPYSNSYILNVVAAWADELLTDLRNAQPLGNHRGVSGSPEPASI